MPPPIIDVHMHAMPPGSRQPNIPCENSRRPCNNPRSAFQTADEIFQGTLEAMRRFNIVRGGLSWLDYRSVENWVAKAPDRFIAGAAVLLDSTPGVDSLRALFASHRFSVLGEIGTQYQGIPPNDRRLDPYFALAEELDVPVLIHSGALGGGPQFRAHAGHPELLEDVLKAHSHLRIYVENAGYPFLEEMVAVLYLYPQVYVDVSTMTWLIPRVAFHSYLQALVRAGFADRIMFGSDQMIWAETIAKAVQAIQSAEFLTEAQKRDIFFNNAVRFFRLNADSLTSARR